MSDTPTAFWIDTKFSYYWTDEAEAKQNCISACKFIKYSEYEKQSKIIEVLREGLEWADKFTKAHQMSTVIIPEALQKAKEIQKD